METLASASKVSTFLVRPLSYTTWFTDFAMLDVIMAREAETTHRFGNKPYLTFEHVTMVPMCRKLIDVELLTPREREWLNAYHAEVWTKTKELVEGNERTERWLERETRPL